MTKTRRSDIAELTDINPIRGEYAKLARVYNARWRHYLRTSTDQTLAALDPKDSEHIVDLGCGTGFLLHQVAENNPSLQLVGLDISRQMLRQAQHAIAGHVTLIEADARRLPFRDAVFDAAVVASVLQYLPGANLLFAEVARVLRPGGRIVVTAWNDDALSTRLRTGWINWKSRAPVYAHPNLPSLLQSVGFRIVSESTYSAGPCWQLRTYVAVLTGISPLPNQGP